MSVVDNIRLVRETMAEASRRSGRDPARVRLMAVTKTVDDDRIIEAIRAGVDIVGENYVQEAKRKIYKMGNPCEWHLIGRLQTNKAKYAVRLFDMIHSSDRLELAQELDRRASAAGRVMKVLIEVNIGGEETKSGIPLASATDLVRAVAPLENLSIQGLMTMPPWFNDPEEARPFFRALRELRDRIIAEKIPRVEMRELSMGMTGDFAVAIEEGATIVRIGRGIFGERQAG
ncbi:MAG: YggS family pyridoxal phosphate-dependent enzyme [Proteobacteria bacterium]|nr:YggS family pyridoxal phosphate-dependent enzyme [Pseudomonadota bacterium]MBU2227114.1 YggS family pyridoxal phosphate-dependent enzyme [Pseudomonadota bacterium]MBU2260587.1 YggS family pyridoxal phosphate-dependent enzyme [Pseudomonadota bacterium]